jgi:hypothetical protein
MNCTIVHPDSRAVFGRSPDGRTCTNVQMAGPVGAPRELASRLDALLESLVEVPEVGLGLRDGLAPERDQDAAERLRLGNSRSMTPG